MAKRLTDSLKWNNIWLRELELKYKVFWLYLLDECDHAGIWEVDFDIANVKLGLKNDPLDQVETLKKFQEKIKVVKSGKKWFIPTFIIFQYGELSIENRVHASVIKELTRLLNNKGLARGYLRGYISPLLGAKDKDKDKDKRKEVNNIDTNSKWYIDLSEDCKDKDINKELNSFNIWLKDNPRTNIKKSFRNWMIHAKDKEPESEYRAVY